MIHVALVSTRLPFLKGDDDGNDDDGDGGGGRGGQKAFRVPLWSKPLDLGLEAWTKLNNERKYRHMSIIPFPVCAYAAIHYEGRRLMNELLRRKTTRK